MMECMSLPQAYRPSIGRPSTRRRGCPVCGRVYTGPVGGVYLDLMPPQEGAHTSLYVSHEAEFEAALDYKHIAVPLLGAGVR